MLQSLTLILPFVALLISQPTDCSIESFGYMPMGNTPGNPWTQVESGVVVLASKPIEFAGSVFAFTANVINSTQFFFQIYRPINTANSSIAYRLIMSLGVTPTAIGQWEDFYLESFLGKQCVFVRPGDRLGLHFPNAPAPVVYGTRRNPSSGLELSDVFIDRFITAMNLGEIMFLNPAVPWTFLAVGFINTNVTSPDNDATLANCTRGAMIPVTNPSPATEGVTTYIPPTGVPGSKGVTGQQGVTGQMGYLGNTGLQGPVGATGNTGNNGSEGLSGVAGATGPMGVNFTVQGATGDNGTAGDTGAMGHFGPTGITGIGGPMGINLTIIVNGPSTGELLSSEFWQKDECMKGVYIWLAIASFVALVGLVFLLADCCLAGQTKSDVL